jgi:hypothetical protein
MQRRNLIFLEKIVVLIVFTLLHILTAVLSVYVCIFGCAALYWSLAAFQFIDVFTQ